jgi:hypothetical protein
VNEPTLQALPTIRPLGGGWVAIDLHESDLTKLRCELVLAAADGSPSSEVHRLSTHARIVESLQHRRDPRLPPIEHRRPLTPAIGGALRTPELIAKRRSINAQIPRELSHWNVSADYLS